MKCLRGSLVREVCVDVAGIVCAADRWDVRRRYLSCFELHPIYALKEGMSLDFFNTEAVDRVA